MAFTATNKLPGVYIDEIDVPGPIAGVATSVLAVVGPALMGPIATPTLVTNPTQFRDTFGGHFAAPVFYASHAVHGFFENGGSSCYFVRAGTAARSSLDLLDQAAAPNPTLVVTALQEGTRGDAIQVEVQAANIATTQAARGQTTVAAGGAANNAAAVADGTQFRPGDVVLFDDGVATTATVASIAGNNLTLAGNLPNPFAAGATVRVADLAAGRSTLRVADSTGIEPGSYVEISQNGTAERAVINAVDRTNQSSHARRSPDQRVHHGGRRSSGPGAVARVQLARARHRPAAGARRDLLRARDGSAPQPLLRLAHRQSGLQPGERGVGQRSAESDATACEPAGGRRLHGACGRGRRQSGGPRRRSLPDGDRRSRAGRRSDDARDPGSHRPGGSRGDDHTL